MVRAGRTGNGALGGSVGAVGVSKGLVGALAALTGPDLFDPKRFL